VATTKWGCQKKTSARSINCDVTNKKGADRSRRPRLHLWVGVSQGDAPIFPQELSPALHRKVSQLFDAEAVVAQWARSRIF
jgi:hypothetical protein